MNVCRFCGLTIFWKHRIPYADAKFEVRHAEVCRLFSPEQRAQHQARGHEARVQAFLSRQPQGLPLKQKWKVPPRKRHERINQTTVGKLYQPEQNEALPWDESEGELSGDDLALT